ncbi:lipoprotein [Streptomyces sp. NPDC003023]|uniref:lipoprotein n=1 Tax=Streptomyces sp. NPDC003023 TaxID=3364675 RepID=UPI0036C946F3
MREVLGAALLAGTVLGCAAGDSSAVSSIGGAGSACALPVTFDVAEPWQAKRGDGHPESAWFFFSHECEIETGNGRTKATLSVYVHIGSDGRTPQQVMDAFEGTSLANAGEYQTDPHRHESDVASSPALEWDYRMSPPDSNIEPYRVRRLAVLTPADTVVVSAEGSDAWTREAMNLVRSSIRTTAP